MYRLKSCACSFLHAFFLIGFLGGVFSEACTCRLRRVVHATRFSSCIVSLLVRASTRPCSTGHNLVAEELLLGEPIFIWANSP
jgi:hypothetical protein